MRALVRTATLAATVVAWIGVTMATAPDAGIAQASTTGAYCQVSTMMINPCATLDPSHASYVDKNGVEWDWVGDEAGYEPVGAN